MWGMDRSLSSLSRRLRWVVLSHLYSKCFDSIDKHEGHWAGNCSEAPSTISLRGDLSKIMLIIFFLHDQLNVLRSSGCTAAGARYDIFASPSPESRNRHTRSHGFECCMHHHHNSSCTLISDEKTCGSHEYWNQKSEIKSTSKIVPRIYLERYFLDLWALGVRMCSSNKLQLIHTFYLIP